MSRLGLFVGSSSGNGSKNRVRLKYGNTTKREIITIFCTIYCGTFLNCCGEQITSDTKPFPTNFIWSIQSTQFNVTAYDGLVGTTSTSTPSPPPPAATATATSKDSTIEIPNWSTNNDDTSVTSLSSVNVDVDFKYHSNSNNTNNNNDTNNSGSTSDNSGEGSNETNNDDNFDVVDEPFNVTDVITVITINNLTNDAIVNGTLRTSDDLINYELLNITLTTTTTTETKLGYNSENTTDYFQISNNPTADVDATFTTTATAITPTKSERNTNMNSTKRVTVVESNRSRVNNVFELSRKMMFNESTDNQYRRARAGKITLLGLFELSTRHKQRLEGLSELAAAEMAVNHINKRNLLPGYMLELLTNDTKCDPGVGVDRFFHALYTKHLTRMVMLLGSACSEVTESLAKIVPYWNIVQVSFGSTSPALSDRREFPLFYRTVAPDSSHNAARIAFIRKFGWDTVTTFSQNEEIYSLAVNELVTELENANISTNIITFAETDFKDQLQLLRELDTRIIIGSFSEEVASKIFCEVYKLGMYGADYAWILQEELGSAWWLEENEDCAVKQLQAVVEHVIIVSSYNRIVGNEQSFSGLNNSMFFDELKQMHVPEPYSRYAPQTYDAVWAIALALKGAEASWKTVHKSFRLDEFDYTRNDMAAEFLNQFSQLNFLGVSGPVSFDGADRIGYSAFYQVQSSQLEHICLFYPDTERLDFDCPQCVSIEWHKGQVPIAKRILKLRVATINRKAFYIITSAASVGIMISIAFLAFNLHFRKLKAIKLSSPKLSNITAVGCILVYTAVILLGLDYSTLPGTKASFPTVCTARLTLLSAGFSLAFGSMFAKTYRVHRIFTYSGIGLCKDKILQDSKLILLVCALLVIDGLVVTLWVVTDPLDRHLSNLTLEISAIDRSVVYQPQVEVCRSNHTSKWLGALYIYKGLLLVVGVYMAWETRHVKISALNDSQYIGISVYSVVITSVSVVVLANLLSERVTLAYIITTTFILSSTTATLCLLFMPKINDIWNRDNCHDPVTHSMGLKIESNTRRFVMDDSKEIHYRVEVQNRVYKKEITTLDAEILKLEKMLEHSSTSSSTASVAHHMKNELKNMMGPEQPKSRAPSITGGLPLLLLSVLPPVIPRASWPSAAHMSQPMRKSVTFSSEPNMEDDSGRLPAIDLLNLRLRHQKCMENRGILDRIKGIFGSRAPSRKASTSSISGTGGIAAAFKAHMGLITGLVPNAASSCHTLNVHPLDSSILRRPSLAKSGTAINIEITEPEFEGTKSRRQSIVPSSAYTISYGDTVAFDGVGGGLGLGSTCGRFRANELLMPSIADNGHEGDTPSTCITYLEPKVNFQLPANRRPSIAIQQPTLRERIKGSPRFPHRILPTGSLNALMDDDGKQSNGTKKSRNHFASKNKWKSMEESSLNSHNPVPILKIPDVHSFSFASKKCNGEEVTTTGVTENGTTTAAVIEDPNAIESIPIEHDEEFE